MVHCVAKIVFHVVCCSLKVERGRAKSQTGNSLTPFPTSSNESDEDETNYTNVEAWPQWTNVCEMGRWFDDLIAARTHRRIEC